MKKSRILGILVFALCCVVAGCSTQQYDRFYLIMEFPDSGDEPDGGDSDSDVDGGFDTDTDTDDGGVGDSGLEDAGLDCIDGNVVINNSLDIAAVSPYTCITGDLDIYATSMSAVNLPNLEEVSGDIRVDSNDSLVDLDLSGLEVVGGDLIFQYNTLLSVLDLPFLETVGGDFEYIGGTGGEVLTELNAESLISVAGFLRVNNTLLSDLDGFSSLTYIETYLIFGDNEVLPYCAVCDLLAQVTSDLLGTTVYLNLEDSCWDGVDLDC